jgi:hypothetical protein
MATPLNKFKTVTVILTNTDQIIYTTPAGFTGIILMAQVANIDATNNADVTFGLTGLDSVYTELVKGYTVPIKDAATVLTGKLVVEEGCTLHAFASANNRLKMTLSVLESLNA